MARKTAIEAARTRRRILEAASEMFAREGVASTTLEQIAQQAGVTRGAIYWHFKGKQDLLQTLFDEQPLPLEGLAQGIDLNTGWQQLYDALVATVSGDLPRRLHEIMMYQGTCAPDALAPQQRLVQLRRTFMHQIQALLDAAIRRGELPATLDVQGVLDFFRLCITGLLYEHLQDTHDQGDEISSALAVLLHVMKEPPRHLIQEKHR